jgi:hypothetical protein
MLWVRCSISLISSLGSRGDFTRVKSRDQFTRQQLDFCSALHHLYHYIVYNTKMGQSASKSTSKSRTSQSATQSKVTQSPSTRSTLETGNGNLNTQPRQSDHPSPQPDNFQSNPHETPSDGQGEWILKDIPWPDPRVGGDRRMVRILMQDANGPCSLIALGRL